SAAAAAAAAHPARAGRRARARRPRPAASCDDRRRPAVRLRVRRQPGVDRARGRLSPSVGVGQLPDLRRARPDRAGARRPPPRRREVDLRGADRGRLQRGARPRPGAGRTGAAREADVSPRIVVYGPPGSPFVEKVFLGLAFKGLTNAQLVAPRSADDYRRWNPETGMLPLMDFDGTRIPDSTA